MTRISPLFLAAAITLLATISTAQSNREPPSTGLHSLFVTAGKLYFGTATEINNLDDPTYQNILSNPLEFGQQTPENSQKWGLIQPNPGGFSFNSPDRIADLSNSYGHLLRCHTLTWHSQLPPFVSTTAWTPDMLRQLITTHITAVVSHFGAACYAWDVVNEALNENGTLRNSVFFEVLGEGYIAHSFRVAAEVAPPQMKLYYNDFNLETAPEKQTAAVELVKSLQAQGVRIDGVGLQAHFTVGQTPSLKSLIATLKRFTELGVDVAWTELDVAHEDVENASELAVEQQAKDYVAAVRACVEVERCVGVTVWQFTDRYSWVPGTFPGKGGACLWTDEYQRKPAYWAVKGFLEGWVAKTNSTEASAGANGTTATTAAGGRGTLTGVTSGSQRLIESSIRVGLVSVGVWLVLNMM
ncbi:family 10 putative glycoside hydrolase [Triangularia setosa]|uniref:Beta-xylanase n=1 Tax=Triangularia setosa TaxID=2587417 RepID=A0AAN6WH43_9PEZI|nr:family 10 putative glycoside hydrolase [Podospora setosa]